MTGYDPAVSEHHGRYGDAVRLSIPDRPDAAETVCGWLITAPIYHPAWSQYSLAALRLRDGVPGFPPPVRQFLGATHEISLVALNPEAGARTRENIFDGPLRFLTPVNIAHQIQGTDDEAEQLAWFAAWAVTTGLLNPETADAPQVIRHHWDVSLIKSLAHIRGEEHAP